MSHSFGVGTLFKALKLRRSFKGIKPRIIASESFSKFCPSDAPVSQGKREHPSNCIFSSHSFIQLINIPIFTEHQRVE